MDDLTILFEERYGSWSIEELNELYDSLCDDGYIEHHLISWLIEKIEERK